MNPEGSDPVFWDSPRVDRMLRKDLGRILDEAGLPTPRLHGMCHTFASILISLGLVPGAYGEAAGKLQEALFPTDRPLIGPRTEAAPSETAKGRVQLALQEPAVP